jgi:RimJ/RimL family protein N-acetyltransferase
MNVLETDRLLLRRLDAGDAAFILGLLNEPSWLQFIGDKGVRTLDDARAYIATGPMAMYERYGFGMYWTGLKSGEPIGICGLVKRPALDDVDLGFALFPAYWGKGYAAEAAAAVMDHAHRAFGLKRIVAITVQDNVRSIRLLEKLGLAFERNFRMGEAGPELRLFAHTF